MYNFPGIFSQGWLCSQGTFGKSVGIFNFHSLGWGSTTNVWRVEFRDAAKHHTIQQERQTDTYIQTDTHTLQTTIQSTPNISCADIKKACYSLLSCEFFKGRECIRFNHVISEQSLAHYRGMDYLFLSSGTCLCSFIPTLFKKNNCSC